MSLDYVWCGYAPPLDTAALKMAAHHMSNYSKYRKIIHYNVRK